jgi:hypothetical protein
VLSTAVPDPLESELDRLFQLPPSDMVEARNALVDQLRKAGDKAAAARVKALKRPTPTAWALNQVHFREPEVLARAQRHTAHFRELQARDGVQRDELAAAALAQRNALRQAVDAALRACATLGIASGAPQERKLLTTLQAWLAGAADAAPGRLTQEIEPTGFEAVASVGQVAVSAPPPPAPPPPPPQRIAAAPAPDPRRIAQAEQRVQACEEAGERAQAEAERLRAQHGQARAALEQTQAAMRQAEDTLTRLRKQREAQTLELEQLRTAADQAAADKQRAETALAHARAELHSARSSTSKR